MCHPVANGLFSLPPWRTVQALWEASVRLKQELPIPDYVAKIAAGTTYYEAEIRKLWEEFKQNPTEANARLFIDYLQDLSSDLWPEVLLEILGNDYLSTPQTEFLNSQLNDHHRYMKESLLPDLIKAVRANLSDFSTFDYRTIFLYSGALWSLGFLGTVTFDGLDFRDLADLFAFVGPKDEATCVGDRGCAQHVNQIYTVYDLLAKDIMPGHMRCLTSCRHLLLPVLSPLKGAEKHLPGRHDQRRHAGNRAKLRLSHWVLPEQRVWQGKRQEGSAVSKLETGTAGEALAMRVMSELKGAEFNTLNVGVNNSPIDVAGNHTAVEVKTGIASGSTGAWIANLGQPGKAEQALIDSMTKEERIEHNALKRSKIMERKHAMLAQLRQERGVDIQPVTVGVILSPDGKRGDVFAVPGFHLRLPWSQYAVEDYYLGTYDV